MCFGRSVSQSVSEWWSMCHLHVALCWASDKEVLEGIQCKGFDGWVMGLESVEQLPLADVKHAHKALSASSDQQLLFRSVLQHSGPVLMAGERWRGGREEMWNLKKKTHLDIKRKIIKNRLVWRNVGFLTMNHGIARWNQSIPQTNVSVEKVNQE